MKYRNIDRNVRSTVTVAYIYIGYNIWRKCRVEVTSVGLAHARPITQHDSTKQPMQSIRTYRGDTRVMHVGDTKYSRPTRRMQHIVGERERGTVHGGRIRLLPPEINWAHLMLSQSSASSLLCWSCTHWLKCVASVISDVPLMGSHIEGGELGFN